MDRYTDLIEFGRFAASRGLVPATSGNFSCRLKKGIAITRSGADKGRLREKDIVVIPLEKAPPRGVSAETPLHLARYRADGSIGAVLHVHSVAATVLSRADEAKGAVALYGFEMLKSIAGVVTHDETLALPIFGNSQDMEALGVEIEARLRQDPAVPGYLLAGHGLYAWGSDVNEARRHVEGLEFLLECALEERRIRR